MATRKRVQSYPMWRPPRGFVNPNPEWLEVDVGKFQVKTLVCTNGHVFTPEPGTRTCRADGLEVP